jgi:hypothetical protein
MKKGIDIFIYILIVEVSVFINSQLSTDEKLICGNTTCTASQANCSLDSTTCICNIGYETFPEQHSEMCNYEKKSQLIAFLLETFVSFGSGHFYINNLSKAISKFLVWILAYTLVISLRLLSFKRDENDTTLLFISLSSCIFCFIMVVWQIIDIILFGLNYYEDGNNIRLKPWYY